MTGSSLEDRMVVDSLDFELSSPEMESRSHH